MGWSVSWVIPLGIFSTWRVDPAWPPTRRSLSSPITPSHKPSLREPVESACGNCALAMPTGKVFGFAPAFTHPHVVVSLPLNDTAEPCPSVTPTHRVRFSHVDKPAVSLCGRWGPGSRDWHWHRCWGQTVFFRVTPGRLAKRKPGHSSPAAPITSARPSTAFS